MTNNSLSPQHPMSAGEHTASKRTVWIDVLKGIGILFVVFGHVTLDDVVRTFLYSFHMPLFFFVSGYLFNEGSDQHLPGFLLKRFRTLILPYMLFYLLSHVMTLVLSLLFSPGGRLDSSFIYRPLVGLLVANGEWAKTVNNVPLWFLPCLFITGSMLFLLHAWSRGNRIRLLASLLLFSLAGYLESRSVHTALPWMIDTALTAVVFSGFGLLAKGTALTGDGPLRIFGGSWWRSFAVSVALLVITGVCASLNGRVDMNGRHYGNYFLFYGAAFSGICAVVMLSRIIPARGLLSSLGRRSMTLLVLHLPVSQVCIMLFDRIFSMVTGTSVEYVLAVNVWALIITTMTLSFLMALLLLFERAPVWIGRYR